MLGLILRELIINQTLHIYFGSRGTLELILWLFWIGFVFLVFKRKIDADGCVIFGLMGRIYDSDLKQ